MKTISILHFDLEQKQFASDIHIRCNEKKRDPEDETTSFVPSKEWMDDYRRWNRFGEQPQVDGPPTFDSLQELHTFNETGASLCARLQREAQSFHGEYMVEPFKSLYSNIAVGDAVCAWWHIKDMNYGLVLPIQKLPISDNLKSSFMAWRFRKNRGWLNPDTRLGLNEEGHELEEHLLWELNVVYRDAANVVPTDIDTDSSGKVVLSMTPMPTQSQ